MKLAYIIKVEPKYWDRWVYANCRLRSNSRIKRRREKGMKLIFGGGGALAGGTEIWKTLRTIIRATNEDSYHLPMQGWSDFAICGDKKTCNLQFLERLQISG